MTLFEIVDILKKTALDQPNIRTTTDGSVYDALNTNPSVQYDVFHISQTNHQEDFETDYYGLQLFYISRLEDSLEDNRLQIQSIGKEILGNIIRTFTENFGIDYPTITYIPFTQKFNDLTAGVYCNVRLEVPKEIICADDYVAEVVPGKGIKLQDIGITITENGLRVITADAEYDGIGEIRIETNVPQTAAVLQDKEVEYTENGSYSIHPDPAYDGMSSVSVDVLVPDNYDEGYGDGKEDGKNEQKAKLTVTSFTENNTYTRENGWSAVTVNVPATEDRYDEGYADGEAAQKAKMVATAITENGAYGRPDGYSAITVNVPQTGGTDADLIANLQGDYFLIPDGTTHLRNYALYGACFSSITIPTSVSAIGSSSFDSNSCLRRITLPDSVLTLGNAAFQYCINLETVILSNSLTTLRNATFNNCRSLTGITIPSGITSIEALCFNNCSGLTEMTFEGLVPPTINTGNSLGSTAYSFPIYVPCESIDAYKTAFGSYYAPRIQCIEPPQPTGDTAITAITLVVASAITDSGTATTTYSPTGVPTEIHYTSSNPSIATINSGTGVITVISSGSVTICTIDDISGLQDCKQISVTKTPPAPVTIPYTADTSNIAATGETRCVTIDTTGLDTSTIGLVYTGATGLTYTVSGNQVCITFPNNEDLGRDFNVKITATTTGGGSAYADITFHQSPVDFRNKWLKIVYLSGSRASLSNGKGSFDKVTDGTYMVEGNVTAWPTYLHPYPSSRTFYFHLTGNTINTEEFRKAHSPLYPEDEGIMTGSTIEEIVVPAGVTTIGEKAFSGHYKNNGSYYEGLKKITLPNTITYIGPSAFANNYCVRSVTLPASGPTVIETATFNMLSWKSLTAYWPDVTIPSTVTTIEPLAFSSVCLNSLVIPASVTQIKGECPESQCDAFLMAKIRSIYFRGTTPPTVNTGSLITASNVQHIYVPSSAVNTYKAAWPDLADLITAG